MSHLKSLYGDSLALLTDLYELTMAYGYWKLGMAEREAVFHLTFRKPPFNGTFALAAGLETALDFLEEFHFSASDLAYLEGLRVEKHPLFERAFLDELSRFSLRCDVDAVEEGTPLFPHEPLVRVQGPILQAQLLESPLLNIINFQSIIATKAARICHAAYPDPVVEFGMRRAQGIDGALSASRAALIGGCESTSHVLAGKYYGAQVRGTQAHSWIMAFDDEKKAFEAFAEVMPHNCIFLIDTYNSIEGTKHAIEVAKHMQKHGKKMLGVRLDSGDLMHLSLQVRTLLDHAGLKDTRIMASNELDEHLIADLKRQGSKVTIWGVGTHLVTAKDQPALDGVYKLSAIQDAQGKWEYKIKISDQFAKSTHPGILQVRRYAHCDLLYDAHIEPTPVEGVDLADPTTTLKAKGPYKDLLIPVMRQGKRCYTSPTVEQIREKARTELDQLHPATRRFLNPEPYVVGMEKKLYALKRKLGRRE